MIDIAIPPFHFANFHPIYFEAIFMLLGTVHLGLLCFSGEYAFN